MIYNKIKQKSAQLFNEYFPLLIWIIICAALYWLISGIDNHSLVCVNGVEYFENMVGSMTPSYDLDGSIKSCES